MHTLGIDHVDLVVSSILRSLPFYRDLLAPLCWHRIREVEGQRGEAIDREHAPSYWFPRQCPRACCWRGPGSTGAAAAALGEAEAAAP